MHGIGLALGYFAAQGINIMVDMYKADRDTKLRDYIIRHPEFFPEPGDIIFLLFLKENKRY